MIGSNWVQGKRTWTIAVAARALGRSPPTAKKSTPRTSASSSAVAGKGPSRGKLVVTDAVHNPAELMEVRGATWARMRTITSCHLVVGENRRVRGLDSEVAATSVQSFAWVKRGYVVGGSPKDALSYPATRANTSSGTVDGGNVYSIAGTLGGQTGQ